MNTYHDNLLIKLRETSGSASNYKIPRGGLFEYVSCANYFGELMEWWGYFMVTMGYPQVDMVFLNFLVDNSKMISVLVRNIRNGFSGFESTTCSQILHGQVW